MHDIRECYETLELEYGAPPDQVDRAYRELTKVWHPDRFLKEDPSLQEKARDKQRQINAAHERLQSLPRPVTPADNTEAPGREMQGAPTADPVVAAPPPPMSAPPPPVSAPVDSPLSRVGRFLADYLVPVLRSAVLPAVGRALAGCRYSDVSTDARPSWSLGAARGRLRQQRQMPGRSQRRGRGPGRGCRGSGRGRR